MHILKDREIAIRYLDIKAVEVVTAFLFDRGGNADPKTLEANMNTSFVGSFLCGMGFTFEDTEDSDEFTAGTPMPIRCMDQILKDNPSCQEVIHPFLGAGEVNSSPDHHHTRFCVDLRDFPEEMCRAKWPEIMVLLEQKVMPQRTRRNSKGEYELRKPLPQSWWIHADKRPALYKAISKLDSVIVTSAGIVSHHIMSLVSARAVFPHTLIIFPSSSVSFLALLQSSFHEEWSRAFGATKGSSDALTYNPTDVFRTFPFPISYEYDAATTDDNLFTFETERKEIYKAKGY